MCDGELRVERIDVVPRVPIAVEMGWGEREGRQLRVEL